MLQVSVWRGDGEAGQLQSFDVPRNENQTVLDVVTHIQREVDPTLSYRFSCRVGMCGSCAMMVNGEPRWTCRTHVNKVAKQGRLTIEPLRNLPVVKDLVADLDPFFEKWIAAGGAFEGGLTRRDAMPPISPETSERREANAGIECINCAVCYAACDSVSANPGYLGPAALNRAWTLVNDERDTADQSRRAAFAGEGGCLSCHSMGSCTRYCPNELDPSASIAHLKRKTTLEWRKG